MENDLFDKGKKKKKQSAGRDYPLSPTPNSTPVTYTTKPNGLRTYSVDTGGISSGAKRFPVNVKNNETGVSYEYNTNKKGATNVLRSSLGQKSTNYLPIKSKVIKKP
jgi:hypothetical protein